MLPLQRSLHSNLQNLCMSARLQKELVYVIDYIKASEMGR